METLLINKILLLVAFVELMILIIGGTIMLCKWVDKLLNKKSYLPTRSDAKESVKEIKG